MQDRKSMAGLDGYRRENMALEIIHFILLFNSFPHIVSFVDAVDSQSQAFIQTDNHLTFIVGDSSAIPLEVKPGQGFADITLHDGSLSRTAIRLDPPMLDFHEQPVGMSRVEQVTVQNLETQNNLYLLSISGSTVHFHCSFFQDKTVPPGGNTTFDVIFLARQVGNVENTLYIHTSQGSFKYQVFGVGVANPYRLRPYLGAKVPVNSSFSPLIHMHNPHSSTLQVLEMYSSDGDLHLELPTGEREAPQYLWEIPPFDTKPVMRANFIGRTENNHTAFIRIKTNKEHDSEMLILPVEIEVTAAPGIYSPLEMLDFGILRTLDEPKTVKLNLVNSGNKAIHITSVTSSPPNEAVSVDFRPVRLPPDMMRYTTVAQITFKASKAISPKQWSGKIIVKSKSNHYKLITPYQANVLHGSLVYNLTDTYFFSHEVLVNQSRTVNLTNTFNFSVVLYNATLPPEVQQYFSIYNFSSPVMLKPQETGTPFTLKFHPNTTQIHLTSKLVVYTNASSFTIPIVVYNGLLQVIPHRPEKLKGQLDFGTLGVQDRRSMKFTMRNDNPVPVYVREFESDMNGTVVLFVGMEKGNGTTLSQDYNITDIDTDPLIIKPYHFVVFVVNVLAPQYVGAFAAEVYIATQFEDIFIPLTLRTAEGSLNTIPEKILFEKTYPGKIPFKVLKIHSSFEYYMEVRQVSFQPADSRFYYEPPGPNPVQLEPEEDTVIGRIYFDAKKDCKEDCYVGLPTSTAAGHQWLQGLFLEKDVGYTDQKIYTRLQQKWQRLQLLQQSTANVTIELDTNEVRGFLFSAQAHLHWPSLVRKCKIKFPLTQLGNTSVSDFIVENPGDISVVAQILPLTLYPNPQTIIDMMAAKLSPDQTDFIEMDDLEIFRLPDLEEYSGNEDNPVTAYRESVEQTLGVKPHRQSITVLLTPGMRIRVRVGFKPVDDISRTSVILIRNNLTIIDTVVVQGQGGRGEMRFSNRKPGSQTPLLFEMTEKHLKNCDNKKPGKTMIPHFTVRRTFTMRNTGELPFYVHGFSINDSPCEGYGFKVLECQGFHILPNTSRKIDIAFTPDFTMSRIRRSLSIHTSLGSSANYTLQATVPPHTLAKCSASLPRPNWEPILYYCTVCITGFLLFCILVAGYFEADRIFVADILKRKLRMSSINSQGFDKCKVFDLKSLAGLSPPKPPPIPPDNNKLPTSPPISLPKPVLHLANGHVEHQEKKGISWAYFFHNFYKIFLFLRRPRVVKASSINKPESNGVSNITSLPTVQSRPSAAPTHVLTEEISEKPSSNSKNRKTKGLKRHQIDTNSLDSSSQSVNDKKTNYKETNHRQDSDPSRFEKQIKSSTNRDKLLYLDYDEPSPAVWERPDFTVPSVKSDINKSRRKQAMKYESFKERLLKEAVDDKEDTSSTTTESSGADTEDKSTSARDSTPEPTFPKVKKQKTKNKASKDRGSVRLSEDNLVEEDDFVMSSKSKLHKRIKINPKDAFGGNIHLPSTLELPYNLEVKKSDSRPETTLMTTAELTNKLLKKSNKNKLKVKGTQSLTVDTTAVDTPLTTDGARESPPPVWDYPKPSFDSDLSEISQQTESFAEKHRPQSLSPPLNGFSSDIPSLSANSRSSSYSSIVSSSSTGDVAVAKPKKKVNNQYLPFGEPGYPGVVGSPGASISSNWNHSPTSTDSLFSLHTIPESQRSISSINSSELDSFPTQDMNIGNVGNDTGYPFGDTRQPTLMQQLLAERRQRVRQHQLKLLQEDWPGFDIPPARSESLWDTPYTLGEPVWATSNTAQATNTTRLWSTLTNSANSGWNSLSSSLSSIWSSGNPNYGDLGSVNGQGVENLSPMAPVPETMSSRAPGPTQLEMDSQGQEQGPAYDPFNSLGNIWSQGGNTSNGVPWSYSTRPDDINQQ